MLPNWMSHKKYQRMSSNYEPTDVYLHFNEDGTWELDSEPTAISWTEIAHGTWSNVIPINNNTENNSGTGYIDISYVCGAVTGNWTCRYEYIGSSTNTNHETLLSTDFKFMLNCGVADDLFDTELSYYFTSHKVYSLGVVIGDSIAERYPEGNFASYLQTYTKYPFVNKGIGGNQILNVINRWSSDVVALNPDIVVLHIGVNDSKYGTNYVEERKSHFLTLLDLCSAYHCIVMSIPYYQYVSEYQFDVINAVNLLNVFLKNQCLQRKFMFFDYYEWSRLAVNSGAYGYNVDGIHPGITGTQKISEMLYSAILNRRIK
jgi:lysophospholipase L1-like esterase